MKGRPGFYQLFYQLSTRTTVISS